MVSMKGKRTSQGWVLDAWTATSVFITPLKPGLVPKKLFMRRRPRALEPRGPGQDNTDPRRLDSSTSLG